MRGRIPLPEPVFRIRLARLCEARRMDETLLARNARVSRRTVHGLIFGARTSASPRTLSRLAAALGTTVDHLTGRDDAVCPPARLDSVADSGRTWTRHRMALSLLLILAVTGLWAYLRPRWEVRFACNTRSFAVVNAPTGRTAWRCDSPETIGPCDVHRWRGHTAVIYGTRATDAAGGVLIARDAARGDTLWTHTLSRAFMDGWYDAELIATGRFQPDHASSSFAQCRELFFADIDGDGADDMVVRWQYIPWYPTVVTWYSGKDWPARGEAALHVYRSSGRVMFVSAANLDDDAKPEIVLSGTNNAPAYQGAMITLLDDAHWSGASVDSLAPWTHAADPYDGSLARVVFPAFEDEFMVAFGAMRLDTNSLSIQTDPHTGRPRIEVGIGDGREAWVTVSLGEDLGLRAFTVEKAAREKLALTRPDLAARFDEPFVRDWLERRHTFHAAR